jgi:hypothetical protein
MRANTEISGILVMAGLVSAAIVAWPAAAAENTASVPEFAGPWARNSFNFEPPAAGPAPLVNLKRLADGTGDPGQLVGDYNNPILKPEVAEIVKKKGEISKSGEAYPDPSNHCAPYAPPFNYAMQLGMQILPRKDAITIIYSQDDQVRHVRLNGSHPTRVTPSAMGDSVGHYEGDTLVVDTVGIETGRPYTMVDRYGTPHSEALHVVERYRLIDGMAAKEAQDVYEKREGRVGGRAGAMGIDPYQSKPQVRSRSRIRKSSTPGRLVTYRHITGVGRNGSAPKARSNFWKTHRIQGRQARFLSGPTSWRDEPP